MSTIPSLDLIKSSAASIVTVEETPEGQPNIRMFDVASINRHIEASMSALGPGEKVAFIAYADGEGVKGALVGRIDSPIPGELKWTVFAEVAYSGPFTWGAGLKWAL